MKNMLLAFAVASGAYILSPLPASAAPITYVYDQVSSSVPGFIVTGSVVFDPAIPGTFPITNINGPGPYDFGNLLSFDVTLAGAHYSLSDFTAKSVPFGFPVWNILSPFGYFFVDRFDTSDFVVSGGRVSYNTDRGGICGTTGACQVDGNWVAVPEPSTVALMLAGLGLIGWAAARAGSGNQYKKGSHASPGRPDR